MMSGVHGIHSAQSIFCTFVAVGLAGCRACIQAVLLHLDGNVEQVIVALASETCNLELFLSVVYGTHKKPKKCAE